MQNYFLKVCLTQKLWKQLCNFTVQNFADSSDVSVEWIEIGRFRDPIREQHAKHGSLIPWLGHYFLQSDRTAVRHSVVHITTAVSVSVADPGF